jgi:hypothetical protein
MSARVFAFFMRVSSDCSALGSATAFSVEFIGSMTYA